MSVESIYTNFQAIAGLHGTMEMALAGVNAAAPVHVHAGRSACSTTFTGNGAMLWHDDA
jgi:hypothetical protein